MHRIDGPGATVDNKFTDGDPVGGIQATVVTDDFLNDVQEELVSILTAAGVTPAKGIQDQVLQSLYRITQAQKSTAFSTTGPSAALVMAPTPAITAYTAGQRFRVKFNRTSTGTDTINISGLGPKSLKQYDSAGAKVAAVFAIDQLADVEYDGTDAVLLDQLPGATGIIGGAINLKMLLTVASASSTVSSDQIIVGTSLGGQAYRLSALTKTLNIGTVGAGGMDVGLAPVSGWIGIYAIYNPVSGVSSVMAVNSPNTVLPVIYGGANMPSGYTASALLSVVPTNASRQMLPVFVVGRDVFTPLISMYSGSSILSQSPITITAAVPANATSVSGEAAIGSTSGSNMSVSIVSNSGLLGQQVISGTVTALIGTTGNYSMVPLTQAQTVSLSTTNSAGTPTFNVYSTGYRI